MRLHHKVAIKPPKRKKDNPKSKAFSLHLQSESCPVQYVAQFPATLVCNRPNFLFMHRNFLIFLQETVHLLTFKMYGDRLPTSSAKEIMPFFAKLVSCPVSGRSRNFIQFARLNELPRLSRCGLETVLNGIRALMVTWGV